MINEYDVVIIGGGPGGGQCARELSQKGYKIALVERYKSFKENNFSSAGMTLLPLKEFDIPESVIGNYWRNLIVQCSNKEFVWKGDCNKGVTLDFGRLRQFLADETIKNGGEVLMGHRYVKKTVYADYAIVDLKNSETDQTIQLKAKLIVDATGPARRVMYDSKSELPELVYGIGLEHLIEVPQEVYDKVKDSYIFFLGEKWARNGYSWIFPMENRLLKVGSGKIHFENTNEEDANKTSKQLIDQVIKDYLHTTDYTLIDVHGGTLKYSPSLKDIYYKNRVVAIGDAVSSVNPLGGEGIRFAMKNAEFAVPYIEQFIKEGSADFKSYRKKWRKKHLLKWQISEVSSGKMYGRYGDKKIEERFRFYHLCTDIDGAIDNFFHFNFVQLMKKIVQVYYYKTLYKLGLLDEFKKRLLKHGR